MISETRGQRLNGLVLLIDLILQISDVTLQVSDVILSAQLIPCWVIDPLKYAIPWCSAIIRIEQLADSISITI